MGLETIILEKREETAILQFSRGYKPCIVIFYLEVLGIVQ